MSCSAHFKRCEMAFRRVCVGPSLEHSAERVQKVRRCVPAGETCGLQMQWSSGTFTLKQAHGRTQAWRREEGRFKKDYNDKIFNGLVVSFIRNKAFVHAVVHCFRCTT